MSDMGFEIWGLRVFDVSKPFGYFEVFSGILITLLCALALFLVIRHYRATK